MDTLKRLLTLSTYLQINGFKELLCLYIASLNFYQFDENKMRDALKKNESLFLRQDEI